ALANFGPQTSWPYLEFDRFDKLSGSDLADTIQKFGKHLTPGVKTEAHLRDILAFPEEDEPYQDPTLPPPDPFGGSTDPNQPELQGQGTGKRDARVPQPK